MNLHDLPFSNDPHAVLARSATGVPGFRVTVFPIPAAGEMGEEYHETARIYVAHSGVGRRMYTCGLRTLDLRTAPRMIEIYDAGLSFKRANWVGESGRSVRIEFSTADIMTMTGGDQQSLSLKTRHEVFDERISYLALELANESLGGAPRGPMYSQGLSVALLGLLQSEHVNNPKNKFSAAHGLSLEQKRRLIDFIAANFAQKIQLGDLASVARLSPFHFSRMFKLSFRMTPHEYLQTIRVDAAVRALGVKHVGTISEIADACGFSSQSHMTAMMRRRLGTTPKMLRF